MNNTVSTENYYPNLPLAYAPVSTASPPSPVPTGKQRYLVLLTGEFLPVAEPRPGRGYEVVVHAVANALASSREEAMCRAQEHLLQEDLRSVAAWSVQWLTALARDLEGCALNIETPVRLNQGSPRLGDYEEVHDGLHDVDFSHVFADELDPDDFGHI